MRVSEVPFGGGLASFFTFARLGWLRWVWLAGAASTVLAADPGGDKPVDVAALGAKADTGDPEANNALGDAYSNGKGVPQDLAAAMRRYRAAAAKGFAPADFNLGEMYELGRGVAPSASEAFKNYLAAAQLGYAPAQFNVGNMYATGSGVKADPLEAAVWFRQAAERGIAGAQYNLALAYEKGRGVAKDEATAQKWYRAAAAQGYARARYNLGLMLEDGRGSPSNLPAAAELYHTAALQGLGLAQNNYGILLAEGRGGLTADVIGAYAWLSVAVANGVKADALDALRRRMTPAQMTAGNRQYTQIQAQIAGAGPSPAAEAVPAGAPMAAASPATGPATAGRTAPAMPGAMPQVSAAVASDLEARLAAAEDELSRLKAGAAHSRETRDEQLATAQARLHQLEVNNKELDDEARSSIIQLSVLNLQLRKAQDDLAQGGRPATLGSTDGGGSGESGAALAEANAKLQDLTKQLDQAHAAAAELDQLRQENARLKAAAAAAPPPPAPVADSGPPPVPAAEATKLRVALDQAKMDLIAARRDAEEMRAELETAKENLAAAQHKAAADAAAAQTAAPPAPAAATH